MGRAGQYIQQLKGYKAFLPNPLPPEPPLQPDQEYNYLLSKASLALGKLSGLLRSKVHSVLSRTYCR